MFFKYNFISFPFGTNTPAIKIAEGLGCIEDSADKLDDSGADFIKTSTGTGSGGCRIGDIRLMRKICGDKVKIKAAAQIASIEDALAVIEEGASAIGENTAVKLLADWDKQLWE